MHQTDNISPLSAFHRFRLGDLELTVVSDGHIVFDPPQPVLAPGIAKAPFVEALRQQFLLTEAVTIAMNILIIRKGRQVVLIDAGAGPTMGERSGRLLPNLRLAGIQPEVVTDIVLTHAHSDHIGGLLTAEGRPAFPNAAVYLTRTEHDFWLTGPVDLSRSKLADHQGFIDFSLPIVKAAVVALGDRLRLIAMDEMLFGFIRLLPAPGHTPGHVALLISSESEELLHIGDTAHTHAILFDHPEWGFEADADFEQGIASRIALMEQLAESRGRAFSFHLPWPGLGHVRRKGSGYEWVSEPFTSFPAR